MPGLFNPKNGARVGFGVGFCESGSGTQKRKNPVSIENTGFFVELLPGFEPGTSSLPKIAYLTFLKLACRFLKPHGIETTGFFHFRAIDLAVSCCAVPCGVLCCRCGFWCGVLPAPTKANAACCRRRRGQGSRARLALRLKEAIAAEAKAKQERTAENRVRQISDKQAIDTKKELAKVAGVSHDTIHKVDVIEQKAPEEVKAQLRRRENKKFTIYS